MAAFSHWQALADTVLAAHAALVLFVVCGLPLIVVGRLRGWGWVDSPWFRIAHLATIAVVAAEAWLGVVCPLTTLEMALRAKAQATTYAGTFIEHWLARLLFYTAPGWVFTVIYSLFGLAVVATWVLLPPRRLRRT
jgi:hypothetical protein